MPARFGAYTIYEELGSGGMASVHLADWRPIGKEPRRVALKRLYSHVAKNEELLALFIDEARLARYLNHPNIAQVYEFGRLNGEYFISFEFVQGPTLQQLQKHCEAHVGYMPIPIVLEIAIQLCEALDHAHNLCDEDGLAIGLVHRDVSPPNLIVSTSGFVKLIDFGLAKAKQSSHESQAGIIKGKLRYVAPEYIQGGLDVRCDLWAVGVIVHELLTGKPLFDAPDDFRTVEQVMTKPIPPPSRFRAEVSPELDDIVLLALQRDPNKRYQNAATLRAALRSAARKHAQVTKAQLVAWVEWAFAQKQTKEEGSGLLALEDIIKRPSQTIDESNASARLPATVAAVKERVRESVAAMPAEAVKQRARENVAAMPAEAVKQRLPPAPRRRIWPLLIIWLVIAGAIAAAAVILVRTRGYESKPAQKQVAPAPPSPAGLANCPLAVDGAVATLQNIKGGVRFTITAPDAGLAELRRRSHEVAIGATPDAATCPVVTDRAKITATDVESGAQIDIVTRAQRVEALRQETRDRVKSFAFPGATIKPK